MAKVKEDGIGSYLAQFRTHIAEIQDHLNGRQNTPFPPSFVSPTGYWTALEKDAFFHALSVYSRLRPDLIAASIRTKTTLEVCAYIDLLEQASQHNSIPSYSLIQEMDAAREMSESWVAWEEENASKLISVESAWEREAKTEACHQTNNPNFEDQEAILLSLRPIHLAVLETMLNKSEGTKRSRIRKKFAAVGIDANFLSNAGLGLFRLDVLGRLMKSGGVKDTKISADTIRLLEVVVSEFIGRVIHHAIISREQEKRAKADTKAWGDLKLIGTRQIEVALQSMGVQTAEHFPDEPTKLDDVEEPMVIKDLETLSDIVNQGESSSRSITPDVGLQREWHPPYIYLHHMAMTSANFNYLSDDDASSLSTDVHEDSLSETKQEEKLDENMDIEDRARDVSYEDYLWSTTPRRIHTERAMDDCIS